MNNGSYLLIPSPCSTFGTSSTERSSLWPQFGQGVTITICGGQIPGGDVVSHVRILEGKYKVT